MCVFRQTYTYKERQEYTIYTYYGLPRLHLPVTYNFTKLVYLFLSRRAHKQLLYNLPASFDTALRE